MKRIIWLGAIASIVVVFLGCSGSRDKKALPSVRYSSMTGRRTLVVLLPTAGGLDTWEDCPFLAWTYACNLWKSLKVYVSDSRNQSKVVLGFGREDKFANQCLVLADVLLPEQVFTVSGGHDWATWKKLWIKAADYYRELKIQRER